MSIAGKHRLITEDILRRHLWRTEQAPTGDPVDFDKWDLFLKHDIQKALAKARRDGAQIKRRPKRKKRV